jgi:hypothetical protein
LEAQDIAMDIDKLNKWLTLVANFGVVAGIFFLAIEIRQNQTAIEESNRINVVESRRAEINQYNEWRALVIADDNPRIWLAGRAGQELSPSDQLIFRQLCVTQFWLGLVLYESSVALGRTHMANGAVSMRVQQIRQFPGYKTCWDGVKPSMQYYGESDFVDLVDAELGVDKASE